jgi:hypothetical protein
MDDRLRDAIANIAPILNGMAADPDARVSYETLSGGLAWSDEFPGACERRQLWKEVVPIVRMLLRHRSMIIINQAGEDLFGEVWEEAMRQFPNWPGFEVSRRSCSYAQLFFAEEAKANRELENATD